MFETRLCRVGTTQGRAIAWERRLSQGKAHMFRQSSKLANVLYDIRGPVLEEAEAMEAAGHTILKLNIGNPAPFGFEAPEAIVQDMVGHLPHAQGYSESRGILSGRRAVVQHYESKGITNLDTREVFLGNGVSELITPLPAGTVQSRRRDPRPQSRLPAVDRLGGAVRRHPEALSLR